MVEDPKLDKIPEGLVQHMKNTVEMGTSDANTPLEAMLNTPEGKKRGARSRPIPPKVVDIDGYKIYGDTLTMVFFKLVQLKNTEVDKILTDNNFVMSDLAHKSIYPRPTNESTDKPKQ